MVVDRVLGLVVRNENDNLPWLQDNNRKGWCRNAKCLNDDEATSELLCQGSSMELSCLGVESQGSFSNLGHQSGLLHGSLRNLKAHTLWHCQANWVFQWYIGNWGLILVGLQGLKAHTLGKPVVFKGFLMFLDSPADRESDSALAELRLGNTLADQSSLLRWMLFVLARCIISLQ